MIKAVLDASAVLSFLNEESGCREVEQLLPDAAVNAVNMAEVAGKLTERGGSYDEIRKIIESLGVEVVSCDLPLALRIGHLRSGTRILRLSLGDRACLATAIHHDVPAVTADRDWKTLKLGIKIQVIR